MDNNSVHERRDNSALFSFEEIFENGSAFFRDLDILSRLLRLLTSYQLQ